MLSHLAAASGKKQIALIKALGVLKYNTAVPALIALAETQQGEVKKQALFALAEVGNEQATSVFVNTAEAVVYKADESETMFSYLHFANRLAENGQKAAAKKLCDEVMKNCINPEQLIFRSSALKILRTYFGSETTTLLLKEIKNSDAAYRNAVLIYAADGMTDAEATKWVAAMKKAPAETKVQIIPALAKRTETAILSKCILPSLNDASPEVRIAAIRALALNQKEKAIPALLKQLEKASQKEELAALNEALLQTCSQEKCKMLVEKLDQATGEKAVVLLETIAARRGTSYFSKALNLCSSDNAKLKEAAFQSLKKMATPENLNDLLNLLQKTEQKNEIEAIQQAVIAVLQTGQAKQELVLQQMNVAAMKNKLLPVLPFLNDSKAFSTVTEIIEKGTPAEKQAAYEALLSWKNADAIPYLYSIIKKGEFAASREKSFSVYLNQVMKSNFPDDQKLLLVRKLILVSQTNQEKSQLIQTAGSIKTFLSLVFVAEYLDDEELSKPAAQASMKIMLPTPGEDNALQGSFVRTVAEKVMEKISGPRQPVFQNRHS